MFGPAIDRRQLEQIASYRVQYECIHMFSDSPDQRFDNRGDWNGERQTKSVDICGYLLDSLQYAELV